MEITVAQLAAMVHGTVDGDASVRINNYSKIEEATEGCLTFLANVKYTHFIYTTKASAVLVRNDFQPEKPISATLIRVEDPYKTLADLLNMVSAQAPEKVGIEQPCFISEGVEVDEKAYVGAFAYIGKGVKLGKGVKIYPQVYVGDDVTIGDNVILYPGVKVYHGCKIGNRCIVHGGATIGADGFGFAPKEDGTYEKISQIGIVILEDDVEIGANTTIDRSTMGSTRVHKGVKIDNLVHLAHNVEVGENTAMAAQVGVSGSTHLGKNCVVGGQSGFVGHITIADGSKFGGQSGIMGSIKEENQEFMGTPIQPMRQNLVSNARFRHIDEMARKLDALEKELKALKDSKL